MQFCCQQLTKAQQMEINGRKLLTREMATKALHVSSQTLRNWEKQGIFIPNRIMGRVFYWEDQIEAEIERLQSNKNKTYHR